MTDALNWLKGKGVDLTSSEKGSYVKKQTIAIALSNAGKSKRGKK